jgi:TIR domain
VDRGIGVTWSSDRRAFSLDSSASASQHSVFPGSLSADRERSTSRFNSRSTLLYVVGALLLGALVGVGGAKLIWSTKSRSNAKPAPLAAVPPSPPEQAADAKRSLLIFVSYSRKDADAVDRLVHHLEDLGFQVWIDRHSTGSQRYAAQIVGAIRASKLVALMCSRNAFASDQVIREVYVAGDNKKPFIVFQLDLTDFPDEVQYFISGFPRIEVANLDLQGLRSEIVRVVTT